MPESESLAQVIGNPDLRERATALEQKTPTQLLAYIAALLEISVAKQTLSFESLFDIQNRLYSLTVDVGNSVEVTLPDPLPVKIEDQFPVKVEIKNIRPISVTVD